MVIYSCFLLFSRWQGSWQQWSTFARRRVGMPCIWSPIAMVSALATSWGLCGHCSWRWDIASPHFSSAPRGCFTGTRTFDVCMWSSMRGLRTDHIHRIYQVVEVFTPRWTFEGGMREATWEALAVLRHEANEQMEHSKYYHFPNCTREGAEAVVMPAGDHDHIGCFTD
jgi:hypothetical protein